MDINFLFLALSCNNVKRGQIISQNELHNRLRKKVLGAGKLELLQENFMKGIFVFEMKS